MPPLETIPVNDNTAQGVVCIYKRSKGEWHKVREQKNTILPNARRIMSYLLAGVAGSHLNRVQVFSGATLLATLTPTVNTHGGTGTSPDPYYAEFKAQFEINTFSGTFDTIYLGNTSLGQFSQLNLPAPLSKSNTEQLLVVWKIKFI